MAFEASSLEGKKHNVRPSFKTRRAFVNFYWNLSKYNLDRKEDSAANFLRQERAERGYDYTLVENSNTARSRTNVTRRKLRSSCSITSDTKREALGAKRRIKSIRAETIKHSGAGFEGVQTHSDRFSGPLKVDKILQTKSLMSQKTSSLSPVTPFRQGKTLFRPAVLPSSEEYSVVRNSMDLPPTITDICADTYPENKPTIHYQKDGIAISSPEMLPEKLNIDFFPSSTTSPSLLAGGFTPDIMPNTALNEDLFIPHVSVPLAAREISSDGTSSLKGLDIQSTLEEPAHIATSNDLLDQADLCDSTTKPPLPWYPPIWAQVVWTPPDVLVLRLNPCSLARRCANPSIGFAVTKEVSILPMTTSKAIFLVHIPPCNLGCLKREFI